MTRSFDPSQLFTQSTPAAAGRWNGLAEFNFVGGNNDPEGVPTDALADTAQRVLQKDASLLATYNLNSGPQGHLPLREYLVGKLKNYRGINCTADDLLITSGSLQGLDLVNQLFVDAGDTVLIEEHTYGGALSRLKKIGANIIGVPLDDEGIRVDALESILSDLQAQNIKPKYLYTIPTVQNPTAAIMGEQRRRDILSIADQFDIMIFEDECYADLFWGASPPPPALYALDESRRVVHIGSFSKNIAPALRVGYILADWAILSRILASKSDAGSGALEQMVLAEFCKFHFDEHLGGLNQRLHAKSEAMCDALTRYFGDQVSFTRPEGGIFLWMTFPESVDTQALAAVALEAGVAFNPGPEWSTNEAASRHSLRLCFASPSAQTIDAGVKRLAEVFQQHAGLKPVTY